MSLFELQEWLGTGCLFDTTLREDHTHKTDEVRIRTQVTSAESAGN